MDEPPKLEEPLDEADSRMKRIREANINEQELEEKYYRYGSVYFLGSAKYLVIYFLFLQTFLFSFVRYGIKPEWLIVQRIINHRVLRDGRSLYMVKWRDLSYDQATWEEEQQNIPGLKRAIEYYLVS
jgi:chromodomain-helicase-DNA-binding protein 4